MPSANGSTTPAPADEKQAFRRGGTKQRTYTIDQLIPRVSMVAECVDNAEFTPKDSDKPVHGMVFRSVIGDITLWGRNAGDAAIGDQVVLESSKLTVRKDGALDVKWALGTPV